MKKTFIFLFIFSLNLFSNDTIESLYIKMRDTYSRVYPKRFEAEIRGDIVDKQIGTVPIRNYTSTRDKIVLRFYFTQGAKPSFVLENVDSFYRNMFAIFEGPLETTGLYAVVGVAKNFSEFSKRFSIESMKESGDFYEVMARAKGEDRDYSVRYVIDKDSFLVRKAEYYYKNSKKYDIDITYQNIEEYTLPDIITYKSSDGVVNSNIKFLNVKTFSK